MKAPRSILAAMLLTATLTGMSVTSARAADLVGGEDGSPAMPYGAGRMVAHGKGPIGGPACNDLFGEPIVSARKVCSVLH